ncbi:hypothetical protein [Bifidobacterium animalis]|uniref:hypothetical protein n=1 Tax=Bifidobacterium animalis TaxID=28025 RepID=UPI00101F90AC|nr:hypothetical protein [Bifidobacterium animalis]RYN04995.1 DoxX [Bifidobacterium animalis subsp. lactis]
MADKTDEFTEIMDTKQDEPYRPVFDPTVRTIIYVVCLLASIVALGFAIFHGDPRIGEFVSIAAGLLASGFGVAYNPNRSI